MTALRYGGRFLRGARAVRRALLRPHAVAGLARRAPQWPRACGKASRHVGADECNAWEDAPRRRLRHTKNPVAPKSVVCKSGGARAQAAVHVAARARARPHVWRGARRRGTEAGKDSGVGSTLPEALQRSRKRRARAPRLDGIRREVGSARAPPGGASRSLRVTARAPPELRHDACERPRRPRPRGLAGGRLALELRAAREHRAPPPHGGGERRGARPREAALGAVLADAAPRRLVLLARQQRGAQPQELV
eukprot:CAMPEP_0176184782 /NCGR_PEP_ID=MMETSP0121_2-20121125/1001_1 /TAXON_ID=160619 /ORGANISM="Kryptoperidinium foliaceum, Strain CCMP 1326" /LENGTH=250 /DNA_ID=CAMNT_0017523185 /DNA_START=195 /DNA_END=944 /DNA_ORIENTATION=-